VDLTLGLRGDVIEKTAERELTQPTGLVGVEDRDRTISNVSPKLALAWHLTDDVLLYASSSLSYRAGVYSLFNFNPQIASAATERTWANEIGAKARLLDGALEISIAGFWYEIENYQIERYLFSGFGVFTAEEVRSRGVELEILSRPVKGLELTAGVGYTDVEFKKHRSGVTGEDLEGRRPPYIPNVTANFAAQYRHPAGPMARVEWLLTGRTFFEEDNLDSGAQSAYGLLNARIGFEQKHWAIYLYGKNLTNTEYYTLKVPTLGVGFIGEPRSVGVMLTTTF
jgi:outer membrane receptor protein involved in Fe transport